LPALISAADDAVLPASVELFAHAFDRFLQWVEMCGLVKFPTNDADRAARFAEITEAYFDDLGHLPPDVLTDALTAVRRRHKWSRLPNPAEILSETADEMTRRHMIRNRARMVDERAARHRRNAAQRKERADRERAELAAAIAAQDARAGGIGRIPTAPVHGNTGPEIKRARDTRPYTPDQLAEARKALQLLADRKTPIDGYVPPHERGAG
jgi:hypothetical protein